MYELASKEIKTLEKSFKLQYIRTSLEFSTKHVEVGFIHVGGSSNQIDHAATVSLLSARQCCYQRPGRKDTCHCRS